MSRTPILFAALAVILCVLVAGCTSPSAPAPAATPAPTPEPTEEPTTVVTTVAATPAVSAAPASEPVRLLPTAQQVSLALTKDRPTSEIHLLYEGGPGDVFVQKITLWVYSSDTEYKEYVMNKGKKPIPSNEIVAQGSRGKDRCVVYVVSAGTTYKIIDESVIAMG